MRKLLHTGCLLVIAVSCLLVLLTVYLAESGVTASAHPAALDRVAAWMPSSWDGQRARASWQAQREYIQELSPVWYQLEATGSGAIRRYEGACDLALVEEAHASDTLVLPLINNHYPGVGFDSAPVATVIHDPTLRAAHVETLVGEVLACQYDGIDLDYESLNGADDREAFSQFVEELAAALHQQGKLLSVTVHPKTEEPGTWSGPQAQDWARLGAAADRFRVMTYDFHWQGGTPGPIAPLWWMEDVTSFAISAVSPDRVYLGIHFYGLDWGDGPAEALEWEAVQDRMVAHGASRNWAARDRVGRAVAEPCFTYTAGLVRHEVWYADKASVAARLRLVEQHGLGGVAIWRLGGEDPGNWTSISRIMHPVLRLYLPTSAPAP